MTPTIDLAQLFDPGQVRLAGLREDLQLQQAPRGLDGAPHWNIYDPVRNRFFRIGWLEFEMLTRWQRGVTAQQLCDAVVQQTVLQPQVEDVLSLLQFLEGSELLHAAAARQRNTLLQVAQKRKPSIWKWFLHNYLFFRVPLIRPDHFLSRTLPWLEIVFQPAFFFWVGMLALLGMWRVLDQWSAFSSTFLYFFSWQGALLYGMALALSKTIHEFGHAYTAKHFGLRVPTMGVAFMMMLPLLYTDTSEGWKLNARRARLAIGGAGVIAELMLAGIAALLWSILPDGSLKSATYLLAAVTWLSTLAINLNPFMRFDGYYLLMDAIDMPNLHERSFAFGRWHLRRLLLGIEAEVPEPEYQARRHWLIAYAYATWLYRLVLFAGIAVAVYFFFFKLAGVILFAVEIGWFVVRPIVNESRAWAKLKPRWQWRRIALSLGVLGLLMLFLALPWRSEISADGYVQAKEHTRIFPNLPAQLQQILVKEGQAVKAGELLFQLQSPELEMQTIAIQARHAGLQAQLERSIGNASLLERAPLLQQELVAAQAMLQSLADEADKLQVRAPHDGVVRDIAAGLYPGLWLNPQSILARVVDQRQVQAQVFVNETEVARIQPGANASLLLRRADSVKVNATVSSIDRTATRILPQALLSSTYGGPLAARTGSHGEMVANEALYRVTLTLADGAQLPPQLCAVQAQIEGERGSLLAQTARRVAGVLVRESGF